MRKLDSGGLKREGKLELSSKPAALRAASLLLAVSGLALATPSLAQNGAANSSSPQVGASVPAKPVNEIGDIVVTARRVAESSQTVPIAITTVTDQELRDLSVRDVVDIQKVTPGLYIQSGNSGGRARLTIRGQGEADSRLTTDGSVGVYIDGVNLPRSYGLRTAMVDLAQVEVLKGPQGTLFGKNTTGGALNITTQHPTDEWGGYVDLTYGSYNTAKVLAALNAPIMADTLALRVVGQIENSEGFGTFFDGSRAGGKNSKYGRAELLARPSENVEVLLTADYDRERNDDRIFVLTYDAMLANANKAGGALGEIAKELGLDPNSAADRLTAYNAWKQYYDAYQNGSGYDSYANPPSQLGPFYDNLDNYGFASNIKIDLGSVTVRSITSYRVIDQAFMTESDATPFNLLQGPSSVKDKNFSQELQLSSIDGVGLDWQVGVFYNRERGRQISANNLLHQINSGNVRIEDVSAVNTSRAAYGQAVMNFTSTFRATGGIRYTSDTRRINSHNRTDPTDVLLPSPAEGATPTCSLLSPSLGGPVYPDCNYVRSVTFKKATWLASVDWRPVPNLMLYGSISTGYRAGGYTQQANTGVLSSVEALEAAFTPFRPESVTNYETGFKSDLLGRHLRINGSFFYQKYSDIQVRIRDFVNGVPANIIRNAAKATLYGGELEVTAKPVYGLTLDANVAYLHARYDSFITLDTSNNPVDLTDQPFSSPKWTFNLGAAYELPLSNGALRFSTNFAYTSSVNLSPGQPGVPITVYNPASLTQDGYGLLDARISWHIDSQDLDVAIFAKNLTDKYYFLSAANGQSLGWNAASPGEPRTIGLNVRKTF